MSDYFYCFSFCVEDGLDSADWCQGVSDLIALANEENQ